MKIPNLVFHLTILSITLNACSKEEKKYEIQFERDGNSALINPYFPLAKGNFWAFEFRNQGPDGSQTPKVSLDTLKVIGDTLIKQLKYWILTTNKPFPNATLFWRDSLGYLINQYGGMVLPPAPNKGIYNAHFGFGQHPNDTLYYYWDEFPVVEAVESKFGTQNCLLQKATHESYLGGGSWVVDSSYYCSLGPIQRSFAYLSGSKMIGTLIAYHLE